MVTLNNKVQFVNIALGETVIITVHETVKNSNMIKIPYMTSIG